MTEKQMVERRTWQEFREAKLLWWINRILHTFGWAIVLEQEEDGSISAAYPARVKFRGFDESAEEEGFIGLSQYMAGVSGDLLVEVLEDECVFVVEDQRSSLEDEVRAMTDEELQLKAAELMGWRKCDIRDRVFDLWEREEDGEWKVGSCPDYPNDIAAAWELWEKLRVDGWFCAIVSAYIDMESGESTDRPYAQFCRGETEHGSFERWESCDDDGGSFPRAITRAFILAMEAE